MKKIATIFLLSLMIAALAGCGMQNTNSNQQTAKKPMKIGVITDLTGGAAYWGESTRLGAELAKSELAGRGYNIDLVFEDYQLDANKALTSVQKLVSADNVDAIYAEFNPAAIAVNSFLKDKPLLYVYDAAVASPLKDNPNAYKTYLDYQAGCREVAKKFKDQGIKKLGLLKLNLEAGELCLQGAKEVYGNDLSVESFNLGDTDFKTQMLKFKNSKIGAIINVGFEGDTLNTLKAMAELKFSVPYGTVDDTITDNVKNKYSAQLNNAISFGFVEIKDDFKAKIDKISKSKLSTYYGAALAYTHIRQMAEALIDCNKETVCVNRKLDGAASDETIGFVKFAGHTADLQMALKKY